MSKVPKRKKNIEENSYRHLSPFEKETIINFNKGEEEASIFTYEKTWQKHLKLVLVLNQILLIVLVEDHIQLIKIG